jgi:hypothetical protein
MRQTPTEVSVHVVTAAIHDNNVKIYKNVTVAALCYHMDLNPETNCTQIMIDLHDNPIRFLTERFAYLSIIIIITDCWQWIIITIPLSVLQAQYVPH